MANFRITPAAKGHLVDIWAGTVDRWGEEQANAYLRQIDEKFHFLAANPRLGRERPKIRNGYFSFPVGKHIIFYLINGEFVDIIGVLHARMDVPSHI
jgi:toxin ParE1/3/4